MVWTQDEIMADELQLHTHKQLFHELKKRFPEVPDNIVSILMRDNHFVRERCIDALGRESNKYLDSQPSIGRVGNLHLIRTPEKQASSSLDSSGESLVKYSDLAHNHQGMANVGGSTISTQTRNKSNNTPGSANTTPSSDKDVVAMYGTTYTVGPSSMAHQNGPFTRPYNHTLESHVQSSGLGSTAGAWVYPPHDGQTYPSGGTSGHSQSGNPSQQTGPTALPQGHYTHGYHHQPVWVAPDSRHATPPTARRISQQSTGILAPSPQQYPLHCQFDYPQYNLPASPNTTQTTYYSDMELPHTSQYNPSNLGYIPPTSTTAGTVPSTSSPSPVPPVRYNNSPTTPGSGGSNASTPTHPYPEAYAPGGDWRNPPGGASELEQSLGNMQLPVGVNGPQLDVHRGLEDAGYTQALLLHQGARMEKLRHDLQNGYVALKQLEDEVASLENGALERKNQRSSTFPTGDDVGKIRDENRRLLIDIQLMTREIDVVNNGQTPLGILDPEQNFYKNMAFTGQRGSIHAGRDDRFDRGTELPHNPRDQVPPARPPAPTTSNTNVGMQDPGVVSVPTPLPLDPDDTPNWNCSACTFLNHPLMDRCEFCEMPRINPTIQGSLDYR